MVIHMNQENEKEKLSGRETVEICCRTMKLMWENFPRNIVSSILYNMMKALTPYIPLYFSAQLLNELAGARRQEILTKWVLLLLILTFISGLVTHLLHSWETVHRHISYWEHQSQFYSRKLLEADFDKIDDAVTLDKLTQIENNQTFMGYGINQFMIHLEKITVAFFQVLGGILLSVSLFTLPLAEQYRRNMKLNMVFVGIAALIVGTVFLPALLGRVERSHIFEWADHGVKLNRVFFAYGFDLYQNKSNALDMRIYRQDLFGDNVLGRNCRDSITSMEAILNKGIRGFCQAGSAMSSYLMMGFIYLYVCLKAWFGAFGIGSVTQYVGAVNSMAKGLAELFKTAAQVRTNAVFLKKIFEFLDIPNEMYQGTLTVEKRSDRDYEVEFRDVSFRYPNASEYALRHVNMKFKVGERLAVVGRNGSGKTTFIKLLCRLYDPTEGQILLNGIDIRKYDYQEYLSIFSVVF
ncbi:MAG: ABC transporter ATP-binding protein/permease, partial [Acetatifactor sp.]|nr:ABC transporter ATP-binding protein/permease [Acetatifactor sp.]